MTSGKDTLVQAMIVSFRRISTWPMVAIETNYEFRGVINLTSGVL